MGVIVATSLVESRNVQRNVKQTLDVLLVFVQGAEDGSEDQISQRTLGQVLDALVKQILRVSIVSCLSSG